MTFRRMLTTVGAKLRVVWAVLAILVLLAAGITRTDRASSTIKNAALGRDASSFGEGAAIQMVSVQLWE
jgi:hypothetical protein